MATTNRRVGKVIIFHVFSCFFFLKIQAGFTVAALISNESMFVCLCTKVLPDVSFIRGHNRWGNTGDDPRASDWKEF